MVWARRGGAVVDVLTFIGTMVPSAVALILGAYGQYRLSLNNKEIEALKGTVMAYEERDALQDRTIAALQSELQVERNAREQLKRELEEEKRLRAIDQLRIAELEGVDKRRRRGLGQFDEQRGLG